MTAIQGIHHVLLFIYQRHLAKAESTFGLHKLVRHLFVGAYTDLSQEDSFEFFNYRINYFVLQVVSDVLRLALRDLRPT